MSPTCPECNSRRVVAVEFCQSKVRVCIDCEWVSVPYGGPPPSALVDRGTSSVDVDIVFDGNEDDVNIVWEAQ